MLRRIGIASLFWLIAAPVWAAQTQIVVQWTTPVDVISVQNVLDGHEEIGDYASDGNDVGSGTTNFYLYADDSKVDQVVHNVITLQKRNLLPAGLRIGVAVHKGNARKDWTYRAAYPAGLKEFDITYRRN